MALLSFVKGANQGTTVELKEDKIVLGRSAECTIVLNVPAVSREHAVIRRIQGKFYIEDLKSRNGTFVNNQEVAARTLLKDDDRIKICDNLLAYYETAPRPPLPEEMKPDDERHEEEEHDSSTVEAMLPSSSKQVLVTQPADKLAMLLDLGTDLAQTFDVDALLPKVVDNLFQVFRQADRGFIILDEDGRLIPKVIKTRRPDDESEARFSRKIVQRCIETGQALLSEDASADQRFDLSQSIADCKIRSVMCVPLVSRPTGKAFGVIQVHTHNRLMKFTPGRSETADVGGRAGGRGPGKCQPARIAGRPGRAGARSEAGPPGAAELLAQGLSAEARLRVLGPLRIGVGGGRRLLRLHPAARRPLRRHDRRRGRQGRPRRPAHGQGQLRCPLHRADREEPGRRHRQTERAACRKPACSTAS